MNIRTLKYVVVIRVSYSPVLIGSTSLLIRLNMLYHLKKWRHRRRCQSKNTKSKSGIHHVEENLESKTHQN